MDFEIRCELTGDSPNTSYRIGNDNIQNISASSKNHGSIPASSSYVTVGGSANNPVDVITINGKTTHGLNLVYSIYIWPGSGLPLSADCRLVKYSQN